MIFCPNLMRSDLERYSDTGEVIKRRRPEAQNLLVGAIKEICDLAIDGEAGEREDARGKSIRDRHVGLGIHRVSTKPAQGIDIVAVADHLEAKVEVQQVIGAAQAPAFVMNSHRAMLRRAAEETPVFGGKIEKGETATQRQSRQQAQNRNDLYALYVHPPQILRLKGERSWIDQHPCNQVLHSAAEVYRFQRK